MNIPLPPPDQIVRFRRVVDTIIEATDTMRDIRKEPAERAQMCFAAAATIMQKPDGSLDEKGFRRAFELCAGMLGRRAS